MSQILTTEIDIEGSQVNVKFRDDEISLPLQEFLKRIDTNPSNLEWSKFYLNLICEIVTEWDLLEDDGTAVPITEERLMTVPTSILQAVAFGVGKARYENEKAEGLLTGRLDKHTLVLRQIFNACPLELQKMILYEGGAVLRRNPSLGNHAEPTEEDDVLTAMNKQEAINKTRAPMLATWDEIEELILMHSRQGILPGFLITSLLLMVDNDISDMSGRSDSQLRKDNLRSMIKELETESENDSPENKARYEATIKFFQERLASFDASLAEQEALLDVWRSITAERVAMPRTLGCWGDCMVA